MRALSKPVAAALCTAALLSPTLAITAPSVADISDQLVPSLQTSCAAARTDATYFIPEKFGEKKMPSGSAAYGYRTGCPLWIVEYSMNSKSNTYLDEQGVRHKANTLFLGFPFDLPSSATADAENATVAEDCNRLRVEYYIYTKMKDQAAFTFRHHVIWKGVWSESSKVCNRAYLKPSTDGNDATFYLKAPDAGVRVIRVAVRVKERSSWQEAAALAGQGPAE